MVKWLMFFIKVLMLFFLHDIFQCSKFFIHTNTFTFARRTQNEKENRTFEHLNESVNCAIWR